MGKSASHSLGLREVYPDGGAGIVGGLLYHGNPDQSFAVLLNPMNGWSIHTQDVVLLKRTKPTQVTGADLSWLFALLNLR